MKKSTLLIKEGEMKNNQSAFFLFKTEDEKISVDVRFEEETVWLSQEQMAVLLERDRSVIVKHIAKIFSEGELEEKSNVHFLHIANSDKPVKFYNLNVIISVGYRVKSKRGTQFRIWATKRLNECIRKGFTMDDERLKNLGGGGYWKELLQRIRDISASEKVFYRQVLDTLSILHQQIVCLPQPFIIPQFSGLSSHYNPFYHFIR